jgi:proteic killer suppression protein
MWSMIASFRDQGTEDVFDGVDSPAARRKCPRQLWPTARRKLDQLNRVIAVEELAVPPGNRLERLAGDRRGFFSIRINRQFRICFAWEDGNAFEVEITDYH